jgi:adenylate cyclase
MAASRSWTRMDRHSCVWSAKCVCNRTHAIDACLAALQIQKLLRNANRQRERLRLAPWECALGSEPVRWWPVSSARGTLTYDVWGNTANISQRLQEACEPGRINISGSTFHHRHTIRD